jgi:hypothetical protein
MLFSEERTHDQERRCDRPPWLLRKCTCRNAAAKSRETAIAVLTNAGAVAVANPRGADAPRSWLHKRSPLRIDVCDSKKRPTIGHGGLTPPAPVLAYERLPAKNDFCDAQAHVHESGGREPAVVRMTHGVREELRSVRQLSSPQSRAAGVSPPWFANRAVKCQAADFWTRVSPSDGFPRGADAPRSWLHKRSPLRIDVCDSKKRPTIGHGGLTPPAPVSVYGRLPAEQRLLRCTNARAQERRASARRGAVIRSLCRERRMLFSEERTHDQERRASARRGSVMRMLSREHHTLFSSDRIHNQERRASARRGSVMRTLSREHHTLFSSDRIHNQEGRASARRGADDARCARRIA